MARPSTITPEAVFRLCNEQRAAGLTPSVRSVQSAIGGATATIADYLRQWRGQTTTPSPTAEISEQLQAALNNWRTGVANAADSELRVALEASNEDNKRLAEELAAKELIIEELEADKKIQEHKVNETTIKNGLLERRIEELKEEGAQLKAEIEKLHEKHLAAEKRAERAEVRLEVHENK